MASLLQSGIATGRHGTVMTAYRIRTIAADDSLDELTAMIHRAFGGLGREGLASGSVDQSLADTSRRIRRGTCLVALHGERIVGTATLQRPDRRAACEWYRRPDVASLHQFAVDPLHQGRGCGSALLAEARAWAQRRGCHELALDTPEAAADLVQFYRDRGFRVVGRMQREDRRYRSVVLSKTIAAPLPSTSPWYSPHRSAWIGSLVRH